MRKPIIDPLSSALLRFLSTLYDADVYTRAQVMFSGHSLRAGPTP